METVLSLSTPEFSQIFREGGQPLIIKTQKSSNFEEMIVDLDLRIPDFLTYQESSKPINDPSSFRSASKKQQSSN